MKLHHGLVYQTRRDLNPGDVFIYVERHQSAVRNVPGAVFFVAAAGNQEVAPGWCPTALRSPGPNGYVSKKNLDSAVVVLREEDSIP